MTEQEWLVCADPGPMLTHLKGLLSERKARLFRAACCRRIWPLIPDERSRRVIEATEEFADGAIDQAAMEQAQRAAWDVPAVGPCYHSSTAASAAGMPVLTERGTHGICHYVASGVAGEWTPFSGLAWKDLFDQELAAHAHLLRDLFGNPFCPARLHPAWLDWSDALTSRIAEKCYQERAFDRLPILADALEEAGCDHTDILNHCRQPGEHVRGCWVVDLLLGRS